MHLVPKDYILFLRLTNTQNAFDMVGVILIQVIWKNLKSPRHIVKFHAPHIFAPQAAAEAEVLDTWNESILGSFRCTS